MAMGYGGAQVLPIAFTHQGVGTIVGRSTSDGWGLGLVVQDHGAHRAYNRNVYFDEEDDAVIFAAFDVHETGGFVYTHTPPCIGEGICKCSAVLVMPMVSSY